MDITGIGSVVELATSVINKIFPDPAQRDAAKLALFQAQQAGELKEAEQAFELAKAQIGVNAVEAASPSLFVSGGRPFIMWICGAALAYTALVEPIMRFVATVVFKYAGTYPIIDTSLTMQVLLGMLGLAGMRSFDKVKGVASK